MGAAGNSGAESGGGGGSGGPHPFQRQNSEPVFLPFKNRGGFNQTRFRETIVKQEPVDYGYEAGKRPLFVSRVTICTILGLL